MTVGDPILLVMEYCEFGNLHAIIQSMELDLKDKLRIACDCAEGMEYLSELGFIHRDIAARNVLLGGGYRAKIADFGMSREADSSHYYRSRGGQIPIRWTAPEALEERKFSHQSDCWSFGILLHEIWTRGELPYVHLTNDRVWIDVVAGYRLPHPEGCPDFVYAVMKSCWEDYGKRPAFSTLKVVFKGLYSNYVSSFADASEMVQRPMPDLYEVDDSASNISLFSIEMAQPETPQNIEMAVVQSPRRHSVFDNIEPSHYQALCPEERQRRSSVFDRFQPHHYQAELICEMVSKEDDELLPWDNHNSGALQLLSLGEARGKTTESTRSSNESAKSRHCSSAGEDVPLLRF